MYGYLLCSYCLFTILFPVPGISVRLAFEMAQRDHQFFLFNKAHKDLVDLFLKNNTGGPAIIFDRYQEKG